MQKDRKETEDAFAHNRIPTAKEEFEIDIEEYMREVNQIGIISPQAQKTRALRDVVLYYDKFMQKTFGSSDVFPEEIGKTLAYKQITAE